VLVGDFNISLTKLDCHPRLRTEEPHALARKEFNDVFIPTLKVVDIYRQLHGDEPAYSWFAKGKPHRSDCARVDFALVDEKLADDVLEMRYLEREDRGTSDHAPFRLEMGIRP
jgi:exonuclease III